MSLLLTGIGGKWSKSAGGGPGDITIVQSGGTLTDVSATAARAFGSNVTSGNKVVIACFRAASASDPFIAGDCTKTAGTSTIGTVALLAQAESQYNSPALGRLIVGIWAFDVTGTGSLTVTIAGATGDFYGVSGIELNSTTGWDGSYLEDTATNTTTTDNTSATSTDATSAGKAIFIGVMSTTDDGIGGSITVTPDAAYTTVFEEEDDTLHAVGSVIRQIVSTGTTDSAQWTIDNNQGWACAQVVIKGAG